MLKYREPETVTPPPKKKNIYILIALKKRYKPQNIPTPNN